MGYALITATLYLSSSAEEAIFNPKKSESSENRDDGCEANADIDDNENDDDDEVIISESNVSNSIVDAKLQLHQ